MAVRRFILLVFVVAASWCEASAFRTELQFGFPGLFSIRLDRPVSERLRVGASFGALPISFVFPFYQPQVTGADLSDEYDLVLEPTLHALSAGVFVEWTPGARSSFFRLELLANVLDAAAHVDILNKETRAQAPYMDVQITATLPRVALTYGGRLTNGTGMNWYGGIGVTGLIGQSVFVQTSGPAAAYWNANPSGQASVQDGMDGLRNEVTAQLTSSFASMRILPAAWISAVW